MQGFIFGKRKRRHGLILSWAARNDSGRPVKVFQLEGKKKEGKRNGERARGGAQLHGPTWPCRPRTACTIGRVGWLAPSSSSRAEERQAGRGFTGGGRGRVWVTAGLPEGRWRVEAAQARVQELHPRQQQLPPDGSFSAGVPERTTAAAVSG
jgi:hypothetical protein